MAGMDSPIPLTGWQKYFNAYTIPGRRNVRVLSSFAQLLYSFACCSSFSVILVDCYSYLHDNIFSLLLYEEEKEQESFSSS